MRSRRIEGRNVKAAFLTGGSGFLGRNLIAALRARGLRVRALARSEKAIATVEAAGAEPVRGDLDDLEAMRDGMRGVDVVFHAAAKAEDWGLLAEFLRANVEGTERVLAAARAAGVSRALHVSTEAVLCDGTPLVRIDETRPRPARAIGLYPYTKGLAEARALAANAPPDFAVVVVRPRFIWGKGDTTLLPKIADAVRTGKWRWFSGGRYLTSTTHVANACEGLIAAAEPGRPGEVYFVTDGEPVEWRAFVTALLETQGLRSPDRSIPRGLAYALAAASEAACRALGIGPPPLTRTAVLLVGEEVTIDDSKARRELGYRGEVTRERGLVEMRAP